MLMLRRLLALVLTCTMALSASVKSEVVCAKHAGTASAPMPGMDHGHHGQHDQTKPPCAVPTTEPCCQAMTSCVQATAMTSTNRFAELTIIAPLGVQKIVAIPLSRDVAPEPPPPKA
jgi:hypothetical protein